MSLFRLDMHYCTLVPTTTSAVCLLGAVTRVHSSARLDQQRMNYSQAIILTDKVTLLSRIDLPPTSSSCPFNEMECWSYAQKYAYTEIIIIQGVCVCVCVRVCVCSFMCVQNAFCLAGDLPTSITNKKYRKRRRKVCKMHFTWEKQEPTVGILIVV